MKNTLLSILLIVTLSACAGLETIGGPPGSPPDRYTADVYEEVVKIERHLHSAGSWFEKAAAPSATDIGDRIGSGNGAYRIDAGNNDWGAWVQVFGSDDTPARTGMTYFDPHEIVVSAAERSAVYFIQFTRGASGAAGYAAGLYTEVVLDMASKAGGVVISMQTGRAPAGSLLWARCKCPGQDTATLDFYIGIHEYDD